MGRWSTSTCTTTISDRACALRSRIGHLTQHNATAPHWQPPSTPERALVLGGVLEEILTWLRGLSGSKRLRALIAFDEVYGYLPPHPANPPTKRPLVSLMKQARAQGTVLLPPDGPCPSCAAP
jgi:phytoene dehydrogenase-like protein